MIWEPGIIMKAWNQNDIFYWKRARRQFPPCCWFCWLSTVCQHSFWKKMFYHWIFSTEFASCCKLIFLWVRKKKRSFEDVNRLIIYVAVFSSVTLWYFDVIRSEGIFISEFKKLYLDYFIIWTTRQAWMNVCIQSTRCLITFNSIQDPVSYWTIWVVNWSPSAQKVSFLN